MQQQYLTFILAFVAVALVAILWRIVYRRRANEPAARLAKVAKAHLQNFLIPDGQGGQIHVEHALLCRRGILVVDVKDVEGNIFGSDTMLDWTVITGKQRFTFPNPQPGLFDREAAIAFLLPDVPVIGYVAFTQRGTFSKGLPRHVVSLDKLLEELTQEANGQTAALEAYWPSWEKLRSVAVVTQLARLRDK